MSNLALTSDIRVGSGALGAQNLGLKSCAVSSQSTRQQRRVLPVGVALIVAGELEKNPADLMLSPETEQFVRGTTNTPSRISPGYLSHTI